MNDPRVHEPAPAPWTLHGHARALVLWLPRAAAAPPPELEAGPRLRSARLGVLSFIRYADSNVGPYDELLWLAPWSLRAGSHPLHSVTRIFVSSEASRANGRANWAIPKQLAAFEREPLGASAERVRVTTAQGPLASFVVSSGARSFAVDGRSLPGALLRLGHVHAARLFEVTPSVRGRLGSAHFSELETDPARFIDTRGARALGAFSLADFEMTFPVAKVNPWV